MMTNLKFPCRRFLHLVRGHCRAAVRSTRRAGASLSVAPDYHDLPFAPRGVSDVIRRMMAEPPRASFDQAVIIEMLVAPG